VSVDCWNRIGVRGDRSCPELVQYVHCRNCPVHAEAATRLLDGESPPGYIAEWTQYVAEPSRPSDPDRRSVLIFRVGAEWLALPSPVVKEVADRRTIHSLPHRRRGAVLGLVSIRGELLVCVSLARVLGLEAAGPAPQTAGHIAHERMLVLRRDDVRVVCAVDEVHGIHTFRAKKLQEVPVTVAKGTTNARAILMWRDRSVGILDDQLLFQTFHRSLA
jgi:chemotaxis-related protein WspD